jgi:hypothetical protein
MRKTVIVTGNLLFALGSEFMGLLRVNIQENGSNKIVGETKPNGEPELGIG